MSEACSGCGQPLAPQDATYDASGAMVCNRCHAAATVSALNVRSEQDDPLTTKNLWGRAATSFALGVLTIVMLLFGVFAVLLGPIAVIMGVNTTIHILREPTAKQALGGGWVFAVLLSLSGIALGALGAGVGILMFLG